MLEFIRYKNVYYLDRMGFFDQLSIDISDVQKKTFNVQFGGGCPLCKGNNTLNRKQTGKEIHAVCEDCGAVFDNIFINGIKLIKGDERYLNQILPINVWRMIRALPEEDYILTTCTDNHVNFYATSVGVIRERQSYSFLDYSDIYDIQLARIWTPSVVSIIGAMFFFGASMLTTIALSHLFVQGGFILPLMFFSVGVLILVKGRKWVYQFKSSSLSDKELTDWRLKKIKSRAVRDFVSVTRKQLKVLKIEDS